MDEKLRNAMISQSAQAATGVAYGAVTKHAFTPRPGNRGATTIQVASAMGAAAAGGAGVSGTVAAGTAVITAKVVAATAVATAAAPLVLGAAAVGAVGYGLYKLFK
jgi:hypothetical protein